jgi:hypothetical protein
MYGSDKNWHCNNTAPPKDAVYFVHYSAGGIAMLELLSANVARTIPAAFFIFLALAMLNAPMSHASSAVVPSEFRGKWVVPNSNNRDIKDLICDDDVADKNILTITGADIREEGKAFGEIDFICKIAKVTIDKQYSSNQTVVVKQTCSFYEGAISGARPLKKIATETWRLTDIGGEPLCLRA